MLLYGPVATTELLDEVGIGVVHKMHFTFPFCLLHNPRLSVYSLDGGGHPFLASLSRLLPHCSWPLLGRAVKCGFVNLRLLPLSCRFQPASQSTPPKICEVMAVYLANLGGGGANGRRTDGGHQNQSLGFRSDAFGGGGGGERR